MGFIYLLTSPSGKQYIGQTINSVERRWKSHVDAAVREYKDHCRVLNKAIRKYGSVHFKVEILEECEDEVLNEKEIEYIEKYNTLVPNGMNIKLGGSSGRHHQETKDKISNSLQGRVVSEETKNKLSETTNPNYPMYLIKTSKGYRVCNHPMGPEKRFISSTKSEEYNYKRALEYLEKLNKLSEPIIVQPRITDLYIQKHKNGYAVKYPGHKNKYFTSKTLPVETLYKNALNYLNELKSMSAVQRLNDSG